MLALQRILMATDFSAYSKEAFDYAVYLAKSLGADLYLLHVFEPPFYPPPGMPLKVPPDVHRWIAELKEEESKRLKALVDEAQQKGAKVHTIFKEGEPFVEILKTAEEITADLIVLSTHGRTGLVRILMGSVAERVVRRAPCPVLTVRPKAFVGAQEEKR